VLLADDVRNTGKTFERCAALAGGGRDGDRPPRRSTTGWSRCADLGVPNFALVEYTAPENHPAADCPLCREGRPITTF
jgi:hypothetical protein